MPISRYQIRNEFSLADPELYRAADKDDPEALLEAVAMAGLVGVLRQLGDLAQFAAEIFHELHEEVMATSARGHGLMVRVQQLEAEVPSLEKAFLSQTHHSSFFSNPGIDWHPNLRSGQNLITQEDLPRFVMDSYEDCRGPPRLFLLDKFDVAGAGACLKRYTDPSFFKLESASSKTVNAEIHREKRSRRVKKKAARLRNGETTEVVPAHAKLHQLLLEERVENAYSNPARLVKLKKRQLNRSGVGAENGRSYMEKFLESPSPESKRVRDTSMAPLSVKSMSEDTGEARIKILEISTVSPVKRSLGNENTLSDSNELESDLKPFSETKIEANGDLVKVHEQMLASLTDELSYDYRTPDETELVDDGQKKLEACLDSYHSDDATSEVDNYVDALTTMESEMDTDNECRPKNSFLNGRRLIDSDGKEVHQLRAQRSASQSFDDSSLSDESIPFKQDRSDERNEPQGRLSDSQSIGTSSTLEENSSFKRDTGEEHMNVHTHFSDSQSVGNSSASEEIGLNKKDSSGFSHSEPSSLMVEDIKPEPSSLSSTKYCEYEIENTHSYDVPRSGEPQKPDCDKFVVHEDAEFQEEEIDSGQTATDSHSMLTEHLVSDTGVNSSVIQSTERQIIRKFDAVELHSTLAETNNKLHVEPKAVVVSEAVLTVMDDALPVSSEKDPSSNFDDDGACDQPVDSIQSSINLELAPMLNSRGTQLVERPSDLFEIDSSLADDEEGKCHVDCIAAVPETFSTTEDGARLVSSSEKYPLNNLDESDPFVCSDASLPISNDSELTPVIPTGMQLVETPSEPVELEDDEERQCQVETVAATTDAYSVTKDDTCPGDSPNEYSLNLDNSDVHSEASQLISNDLNLALVDECNHHSKIKILQGGLSKENYDESSVGNGVNSPLDHSLIAEVDLYSGAALPVDGAEVLQSKDESCMITSKLDCQNSSTEVETPPASSLTSEQFSYFTPESPKDATDSAIAGVLYPDQLSNPEVLSRIGNGNEKSESSCSVDAVEDDGHLKQPSPDFVGQGNHVNMHDVFTGKVQSEDQAVSDYLPTTFPVYSESDEVESSEISRDMKSETRKNQLESSSDIISSNTTSSLRDPTNLEEFPSSSNDPHVNEIVDEVVARDSAAVGLSLHKAGSHDLSDSEASKSIQDLPVIVKHISSANDLSMVSEFSEPGTQDLVSSSCQTKSFSSPSSNQLIVETPVHFLQSEAGSKRADFPLSVENSTSECMHESSQLGQERESLAASKAAVEARLDQLPSSDSASQSDCQEFNVAKDVMDSLKSHQDSILPGSDINLGEMPPMPPLPPMQWRRGKIQHASEKEVIEVAQTSFQPIQAINTYDKGQFGLETSERETLQYQNTFSPVMPVEGDRIPYSSGFSVGVSGQPVAVPLQFPFMVNEANGQYNYFVLDRSQMQNPFLPLPMVSNVKPSHGFVLASEGGMVQYSNLQPSMPAVECALVGHDSDSSQVKLTQPPSQLIEETTSEDKEPTHSVSNLDRAQEDTSVIPMSLRNMELVQRNNSLSPSEGEMASSLGQDPVSSQEKLAQPPSRLIEGTTSEAKESIHSVRNPEGEQKDPSVTSMPPPSMEYVQHNHSLPPSEGEMALSLDIPATTSIDTEGEKPNGILKNKVPRPRNPLIDAVVAHDKSTLRKVTQRPRTETEPKTDERDSLLEQIRTKSFNLKPAVATRPSIGGPKTNLKVAAILEKANAIRQALAGSDDEDNDSDSWSE